MLSVITPFAFVLAIGLLVAFHEYGHYRMALWCGVQVQTFSIGFGPTLWQWTSPKTRIVYRLAWIPLGGFVKMRDEREGAVSEADVPRAFNRQPLRKRAAIVAAGPLANFVLAWFIYAVLAWSGQRQTLPVLSTPTQGSVLAQAGVLPGDTVLAAWPMTATPAQMGEAAAIRTYEDMLGRLVQSTEEAADWVLQVRASDGHVYERRLALEAMNLDSTSPQFWSTMGVVGPFVPAVITDVQPGGIADVAGLQAQDVVISVNGVSTPDAASVKQALQQAPLDTRIQVKFVRQGQSLIRDVQLTQTQGVRRLGVVFGQGPATEWVKLGVWDGVVRAWTQTSNAVSRTFVTTYQMLLGQASWQNLSGPLTIAEYAGKTAQKGWSTYLTFLAVVSVGLGVMNLLPLPVLDGGHLLYYLYEFLSGKPLSDRVTMQLQKVGMLAILMLMAVALSNDVWRLLGPP